MDLKYINPYYSKVKRARSSASEDFLDPIFDRAESDIRYLRYLLTKGYSSFSNSEKNIWSSDLKGAFNVSDINRIENNIKILALSLGLNLTTKLWTEYDIPNTTDFERIADNVKAIRQTISSLNTDTPIAPDTPLNQYTKINDIEKIIFDVYNILKSNFYYYCSSTHTELYCGEEGD